MKLPSPRTNPVRRDWLIVLLFFLAALALRFWNLNLIPSYSDEGFEVLWGLDIALGKHFPLYGYPPHYGPLFAYLIAILFRVFGTSIALPRLMIAVFGALTVAATYALTRVMRDRQSALIAAGLALTSPLLVILASHQGWSSGLTPFFTTTTALALYLGVTTRKNIYFALSGLLAAFALQAHATAAAALVGMAFWFLLRRDLLQWLKQPAPYLALAFFLLGYAPMIIANARIDSPLLQAANDHAYVFAPTLDPVEYLRRVVLLFKVFGYFVGEGFGAPTIFLRAQAIAIQFFSIAAIVWALRVRLWLIPFTVLSMFAILPAVAIPEGYRYSMNVIPLMHALNAIFLVAIWRALAAKFPSSDRMRPARWVAITLIVLFISSPLITLSNSYRDAFANGWTNEGYFALARDAQTQGACGAHLLVENRSLDLNIHEDVKSFFVLNNVHYVLALDGCAHAFGNLATLADLVSPPLDTWLITTQSQFDSTPLERMTTTRVPLDETFILIYLYRLERKP